MGNGPPRKGNFYPGIRWNGRRWSWKEGTRRITSIILFILSYSHSSISNLLRSWVFVLCFIFAFAFGFWVLWDLETTLSLSYEKYECINSKLFQLFDKNSSQWKKIKSSVLYQRSLDFVSFFSPWMLSSKNGWKMENLKHLNSLYFTLFFFLVHQAGYDNCAHFTFLFLVVMGITCIKEVGGHLCFDSIS